MNADILAIAAAYREAVGGDPEKALELAIAELLEARAAADFRADALNQWVSRGYVQGRASELCDRQAAQRGRKLEPACELNRSTIGSRLNK